MAGIEPIKAPTIEDFNKYMEQKSRGLGDTVAKITKVIGIKPCGGCEQRRIWLNKKVPYKNE